MFDQIINSLTINDYKSIVVILLGVIPLVFGVTYKYISSHNKFIKETHELKIKSLEEQLNLFNDNTVSQLASEEVESCFHGLNIYEFSGENSPSEKHLLKSLKDAKEQIFIFGLTRNFYADDKIQKILIEKSKTIPINIFMMHPDCASREDRYRLEPSRAAYNNVDYYRNKVEKTFIELQKICTIIRPGSKDPGISFHYYNFQCSFALEKIDNEIRVFLYGYGKRGTDSPTFVISKENLCFEYFNQQVDWILDQANGKGMAQWKDSKFIFTPLQG